MQPQPPHRPPPPQQPFGQPPQAVHARPAGTNQLAIVSVIAGVVGWMAMPVLASVVAIVCGHLARNEIRKSGQEGDGLAILGLVLGYSHIVVVCLVTALIVAIYGGVAAFFVAHGLSQ